MEKGITVAGNLIVDYVKIVDEYPEQGKLCNILDVSRSIGGCAANTSAALAALDPELPVKAVGLVGTDDNGDYIIKELKEKGVNTDYIGKVNCPTSFTDVLSVNSGQRTFFHARGANALFDHIPDDALDCDILHAGYALLLDCLDAYDPDYGTKMAKLLSDTQSRGIKTSLDVVSEVGDRFKEIVTPCLRHCDYLIINETEGAMVAGVDARDHAGNIIESNIRKILSCLIRQGIGELVVIHAPEGGWLLDKKGDYYFCPSLDLPHDYIKGSVGAGDAFCAGMLYSLYRKYPQAKALQLAVSAAACNLSRADSISGILNEERTWENYYKYRRVL